MEEAVLFLGFESAKLRSPVCTGRKSMMEAVMFLGFEGAKL